MTKSFRLESEVVASARAHVVDGSVVAVDDLRHWDALASSFNIERIDHSEAYSRDGINTNQHHRVEAAQLDAHTAHAGWLEDHRRQSNGELADRLILNALGAPVSRTTVVSRFQNPTEVIGDLRTRFLGPISVNGYFFRRQCLRQLGDFLLDYPLVSDRDMLIRFAERGFTALALNGYVYCYRRHDASMTLDRALPNQPAMRRELLALALAWQSDAAASTSARRFARVLEGRNRIGLARLALHRRDGAFLRDALSWNEASGRGSSVGSFVSAGFDILVRGR